MLKKQAALHAIVATPQTSTDAVVTNLMKSCLKPEERSLVGLKKSFERQVQRKKAAILLRPPKPVEFSDLDTLPDSHSQTADGERFLLANFTNKGKRNLVFASRQGLDLVRLSSLHQGDGTFDLPPEIFYQLYILLAVMDQKSYPAVFALLGDKSASMYRMMFEEIRKAILKPLPLDAPLPQAPKAFMADFEVGAINQYRAVFPEVKSVRGCFVHFKRNHWKTLTKIGLLTTLFAKCQEFEVLVKCIYSLAYVPPEQVTEYYQAILDELLVAVCKKIDDYQPKNGKTDNDGKAWPMDPEFKEDLKDRMNQYLDYVERNYVGAKTRTGLSQPRFPPKMWSVHEAALAMEPTDMNRNEGWNSVLRASVAKNAGLWQLIEGLIGLEAKTRVQREEDTARIPLNGRPIQGKWGDIDGPASSRERRKSVRDWERRNIVMHREEYGKVDFLRRLCSLKERKAKPHDDSTDEESAEEESAEDDPHTPHLQHQTQRMNQAPRPCQAPLPSQALRPSPSMRPILARILQDPRAGPSQDH